MTKLKAVLSGAAALIITGAAVGYALIQSAVEQGVTCPQWCEAIERVTDVQRQDLFFVAVQQGATIPKAAGDRVFGDCEGGACTVAPAAPCDHCSYDYTYTCGPLVDGWRVCEVYAHPYFAKGWAIAAAEEPDLRWYGGLADVVGDCLAHFTPAQCLALLDADRTCWLLNDGRVCRYGQVLGEDAACPYALVQARLPCVVNRGAGSEMTDAQRVWGEEMDEL